MTGVNLQNLSISSSSGNVVSSIDLASGQAQQGMSEFDLLLDVLSNPEGENALLGEEEEKKSQQSFISSAEEEAIANSFQASSVSVILETKVFQNIHDVDSSIFTNDVSLEPERDEMRHIRQIKPFAVNTGDSKDEYKDGDETAEENSLNYDVKSKLDVFVSNEIQRIALKNPSKIELADKESSNHKVINPVANINEKSLLENNFQADEINEYIDYENYNNENEYEYEYEELNKPNNYEGQVYDFDKKDLLDKKVVFNQPLIMQNEKIIPNNSLKKVGPSEVSYGIESKANDNFESLRQKFFSKNLDEESAKYLESDAADINNNEEGMQKISKDLSTEKNLESFKLAFDNEVLSSRGDKKFDLDMNPRRDLKDLGENNISKIHLSLKSISKSSKKEVIKIELNPKDLGSLQIEFEKDKETGVSKVTFSAEKFTTFDLLSRSTQEIQKIISDSGIKVDDSSLKFEMQNNSERNGSNNEYVEDEVAYQIPENKISEYKTNYSIVISDDEVNIIA